MAYSLTKAQQKRIDSLFIAIGRLQARADAVAQALPGQDAVNVRRAVQDVSSQLEEAWRILTDRGIVV
jgi:hypothetical protein